MSAPRRGARWPCLWGGARARLGFLPSRPGALSPPPLSREAQAPGVRSGRTARRGPAHRAGALGPGACGAPRTHWGWAALPAPGAASARLPRPDLRWGRLSRGRAPRAPEPPALRDPELRGTQAAGLGAPTPHVLPELAGCSPAASWVSSPGQRSHLFPTLFRGPSSQSIHSPTRGRASAAEMLDSASAYMLRKIYSSIICNSKNRETKLCAHRCDTVGTCSRAVLQRRRGSTPLCVPCAAGGRPLSKRNSL